MSDILQIPPSDLIALRALLILMEAKSPSLYAHSCRVAALASALGLEMGLGSDQMIQLEIGAGLHDIGKLALPDSILVKGEALGAAERAAIEAHPRLGERILEPLASVDQARAVVRWHHERMVGGGYPDGLNGPEIPLPARVVSISDAYDAMTNHRPHHAPEPSEQALRTLVEDRGRVWDPELVQKFVRLMAEGRGRNLANLEWMVRLSHG